MFCILLFIKLELYFTTIMDYYFVQVSLINVSWSNRIVQISTADITKTNSRKCIHADDVVLVAQTRAFTELEKR